MESESLKSPLLKRKYSNSFGYKRDFVNHSCPDNLSNSDVSIINEVEEIPKIQQQKITKFDLIFSQLNQLFENFKDLPEKKLENSFLNSFFPKDYSANEIIGQINQLQQQIPKNEKNPIKKLMIKYFSPLIFRQIIVRLIALVTKYAAFFMLDIFTDKIKEYKNPQFDQSKVKYESFCLLVCIFISYVINGFATNQYEWWTKKQQVQHFTITQYLIYIKILKVKSFVTSQENDDDDEDLDINNLVSNDVPELENFFEGLYETFHNTLEVFFIMFLIYLKVDNAIYQVLILLGILMIVNMIICMVIFNTFSKKQKFRDLRVSLSTDVFKSIKSIKFLGWEEIFEKRIQKIRNQEFKQIAIKSCYDTLLGVFWKSFSYLILCASIIQYLSDNPQISVYDANVFILLGYTNLLTYPVGIIPWAIGSVVSAGVSFRRICRFLHEDNVQNDNNDDQNVEVDIVQSQIIIKQKYVIEIKNMEFEWPVKKNKPNDDKPNKVQDSNNSSKLRISKLSNLSMTSDKLFKQFKLTINNLQIEFGTLNFVIGRTGSGKTAFLSIFLNEIDPINENKQSILTLNKSAFQLQNKNDPLMSCQGEIAYVSQDSWLQNKSIKDNIIFESIYDKDRFEEVISACCLQQDIDAHFEGVDFLVGFNGSKLSGGQKQRIAIARAVYSNADLFLFDDAFSSLDNNVASQIFERLIKGNWGCYLYQKQKTIFFVTSNYSELSRGDNILVVNSGNLLVNPENLDDYIASQTSIILRKKTANQQDQLLPPLQNLKTKSGQKQKLELNQNVDLKMKKAANAQEEEQNDDREVGSISMDSYYYYFRSMGFSFYLYILFMILSQASFNTIDLWLKSEATEGDTSFEFLKYFGDFDHQFYFLLMASLVIISINEIISLYTYLITSWSIFNTLNNVLIYTKISFYEKIPIGRVINRISNDVREIDDEINYFFYVFLDNVIVCIIYPLVIMYFMPVSLIGIVILLYVLYLIQDKYRNIVREVKRLNQVNLSKINNTITETIDGVQIIRSFKRESKFIEKFMITLEEATQTNLMTQALFFWTDIRLYLICLMMFTCISSIIVVSIYLNLNIDVNQLSLILTYMLLLNQSFNEGIIFLATWEQSMVSIERIHQYVKNPVENLHEQIVNQDHSEQEKNDISIEFSNVNLSYDSENKSVLALNNISFQIKKCQKVAFCGRTGSGKSSILNALFRLYDINSGKIKINNQDILNVSLSQLRKSMSIIPQFGFFFNSSFIDNVNPEQNETPETIIKNIEKSISFDELPESSFCYEDEQGIQRPNPEFEIDESGENLSNGERQIINFLRIVLRKSDIICLDEATSNMDPETDRYLQNQLFNFTKDKTLIVITHRLEQIHNYDQVFVMDKGQIVEQGKPSDLMKINGFFQKLVTKQE